MPVGVIDVIVMPVGTGSIGSPLPDDGVVGAGAGVAGDGVVGSCVGGNCVGSGVGGSVSIGVGGGVVGDDRSFAVAVVPPSRLTAKANTTVGTEIADRLNRIRRARMRERYYSTRVTSRTAPVSALVTIAA